MLSTIRFSGITIFKGMRPETMGEHLAPLAETHNGVLTVINPQKGTNWLNVVVLYGKELYLFAHEKWGVELSSLLPRQEAQAGVHAGLVKSGGGACSGTPGKQAAFRKQVSVFVGDMVAQNPACLQVVDLQA